MAGALEPLGRAAARVVEHAHHADDRRGQNRLAVCFIVEGNVAPDHRHVERAAGERDPLDRFRELPEDLRPLRRAEVQAVGDASGLAARTGDVARRLADRHHGALPRVEEHQARVAVGRHRERAAGALDAEDRGVGARQHQGVDPDLLVVLAEGPLLRRDRRRGEQLDQRGAVVGGLG